MSAITRGGRRGPTQAHAHAHRHVGAVKVDRFLNKIGFGGRRDEGGSSSSSRTSPKSSPKSSPGAATTGSSGKVTSPPLGSASSAAPLSTPGSGTGTSTSASRTHSRSGSRASRPATSPLTPQSDFAASAFAAASAGMKYERVIDENTDLSTLTDHEIMRLMEGMEGDVLKQPLITGPVHLLAIKGEYLRGSPQVLRKLEWLGEHGWDQIWRARGDGDCFYRSFTLAYLLRILYAPNKAADASRALSTIHNMMPTLEAVGFQRDLVDEFVEPLVSVLTTFVDPPPGREPTEYSLLEVLQDAEKSNSIVVALRLITAAYIRTHPDDFAPFLFSPSTLEPISPAQFCRDEVEPCGKEADHAQIMALAAALDVPVRVAYLDRSETHSDDVINWVEFGRDATDDARPLTLLYRPGHFDVVTQDRMAAALARDNAAPTNAVASGSGSRANVASGSGTSSAPSAVPAAAPRPQEVAPKTAMPAPSAPTGAPPPPSAPPTAPTAAPTAAPAAPAAPAPSPPVPPPAAQLGGPPQTAPPPPAAAPTAPPSSAP